METNSLTSGTKKLTLKRDKKLKNFFSVKVLLVILITLQLIIIAIILNPQSIIENINNQQVLGEISQKVSLDNSTNPVVATISDASALRAENAIQAQIYKDAQNGDYVVAYGEKLVVYRRSEGKVIYEGDNPNVLLTKTQEKLVENIKKAAVSEGLISEDSEETPQISLIDDLKSLQAVNSEFYKNARTNDIVVIFPESEIIALYNQESESIFNHGRYETKISTNQ